MKNRILYVAFLIGFQVAEVVTMDCCDHKGLESVARRYALSIANGEEINAKGIVKDLHFLTLEENKSYALAKSYAEKIDVFPVKGKVDIHGDFGAFCYKGYRHSLCHGWSSGVIKFIEENC